MYLGLGLPFFTYGALIALFTALHITFIILWFTKSLQNISFDIGRISTVSQILSTLFQVWLIPTAAMLVLALQTIAQDAAIRRRECHV